ncbi:MAG: tetratricopeptide repeat protein [Hyphomonadaceae bacterium]
MLITITSLVLTLIGQPSSAQAERIAEARRLDACIAKLDTDPEQAYEDGLTWVNEGGRPYARQCTALALVELGQAAEGAVRLEDLANAANGGSLAQRIIYLTQSGNAWLLAGAPEAALVTLGNAIKLSPTDPSLKADRAAAYMALGDWRSAANDLDEAQLNQPRDVGVLRMRAETRLNLNDLSGAERDVNAAMEIDDTNITTLLLRGRVREAQRLASVEAPIESLTPNPSR